MAWRRGCTRGIGCAGAEAACDAVGERPGTVGPVADDRPGELSGRLVHALERDARVVAFEVDGVGGRVEPEPEAVGGAAGGVALWFGHLSERFWANDVAGEEGVPEAGHVVGGRVQAAVADAAHGDVEVLNLEPVAVQVTDCRVARQRVGPEHVG